MIEVVIRAYDEVQILLELVIDSTLELTMKYEKRKLELMMKVILELTTSTRGWPQAITCHNLRRIGQNLPN